MHLVVLLVGGEGSGDGPAALVFHQQGALLDADVAHLTPVFAPGVANDPIHAILGVGAPTHHGDHVVHALALGLDDAGLIVQQSMPQLMGPRWKISFIMASAPLMEP
eukprot:Skav230214  [mRNA]  locus=scaffold1765:164421:177746:+ [translate_table: standard]